MPAGYSRRRFQRPSDGCRPDDRSIPFFRSVDMLARQNPINFPGNEQYDPLIPWLVEPGAQSIEVYEAILAQTVYRRSTVPRLRLYIAEAGLLQDGRGHCGLAGQPPGRRPPPESDCRRRAPRDVCFTLVSLRESTALWEWLASRALRVATCSHVVTPLGPVVLARFNARVRNDVCRELGFYVRVDEDPDNGCFPRSQLPQGVRRMGCGGVLRWALPPADDFYADVFDAEGLAVTDGRARRVHWNLPEQWRRLWAWGESDPEDAVVVW